VLVARGNAKIIPITTPMPPMIQRVPRNRSYSDSPRTFPFCPSERPAPAAIASQPAMAKNATVATKLRKVQVTPTGRGTP
jgi:hypothetical protein